VFVIVWSFATDILESNPSPPLPYLPVLNPLDLAQGVALFILVRTWQRLRAGIAVAMPPGDERLVIGALGLTTFVWLNALVLRTLHLWNGIPYELSALAASTLVQSTLSIVWATLSLTTMLVATRIHSRVLWLTGAPLLAMVVLKLFVIDLSSIGTVERIISFVGVGLLMLVIGYFSPLPPAPDRA
jgi:uncharacterized membrane protein